jgi:hypothetical protein
MGPLLRLSRKRLSYGYDGAKVDLSMPSLLRLPPEEAVLFLRCRVINLDLYGFLNALIEKSVVMPC